MSYTHTYVELPLSRPAFEEIVEKLKLASYNHALTEEDGAVTLVDMHGLAIICEADPVASRPRKVALEVTYLRCLSHVTLASANFYSEIEYQINGRVNLGGEWHRIVSVTRHADSMDVYVEREPTT